MERSKTSQAGSRGGGGKPGESLPEQLRARCLLPPAIPPTEGDGRLTDPSHLTFAIVLKLFSTKEKSGSEKSKMRG